MKKILIVEDDFSISRELKELLDNSGYEAVILENFQDAKNEIISLMPDLVLLDINIPYTNGESLLKELRKESDIPVIMVTSRNNETDEVLSMSYGADDYITKPYNPTILLLRVGAILRRTEQTGDTMRYHELLVCPQKGLILREGFGNEPETEVVLTKNEMIIFVYLLNNRRIVTRDELMTDLWNNKEYINDNALTVNISRLRTKLKEIGYENAIVTRKGQGYMLV
ncbi:MAG: response regulator transcription factor [Lachnospiraceae bacterium]|nr:response regulator transcription factor [Lachnospiraceae bacterium]